MLAVSPPRLKGFPREVSTTNPLAALESLMLLDLITIFHTLLTLFLITQTRVTNIPLFLLFQIQEYLLSTLKLNATQTTLSTLLFGYTSFFAFGNSNAISSIDLSNAYNGVSGFNVLAVGVLLFASNWAGPIIWSVTCIKLLIHQRSASELPEVAKNAKRRWVEAEMDHLLPPKSKAETLDPKVEEDPFFNHVALLTLFTAVSLVAVMAACTALRTHLFIWTVFSPKYLYAMAWGLGFHFIISIGLGGVLWGICGGDDS
jgi:ethanolaminephosphotransferase